MSAAPHVYNICMCTANWWVGPCNSVSDRASFSLSNAVVSGNRIIIFQVRAVLKTLVSLIGHLEPCSARIAADIQTERHTDGHTQTEYRHPRCACAPRVNKFLWRGDIGMDRYKDYEWGSLHINNTHRQKYVTKIWGWCYSFMKKG